MKGKGKNVKGRKQHVAPVASIVMGTIFRPPLTPTRVNTGMWRHALVEFEEIASTSTRYAVTYGMVRDKAAQMYGLKADEGLFEYRIDSARIYIMQGSTTAGCSLTYNFYSNQDIPSVLKSGSTDSIQNQPARVGFKWPLVDRADPLLKEWNREIISFGFVNIDSADNTARGIVQIMVHFAVLTPEPTKINSFLFGTPSTSTSLADFTVVREWNDLE